VGAAAGIVSVNRQLLYLVGPVVLATCLAAVTTAQISPANVPLGLDEHVTVPEDNVMTPAKVQLGERLFFDPLLSADRRVSCATCHDPARAFTSGTRVAVGVWGRRGMRNAPTILNRAYGKSFFWDGRAATLEEQVLGPIQDRTEMGLSLSALTERLRKSDSYSESFARALGQPPSAAGVARALASYVRAQRAGDAPFDRYRAGDTDALSETAIRGLRLFRGRANCSACHSGPNFSDEEFHNTGVSWGSADLGRYRVTRRAQDRGAFKTPTLRQLRFTAPYMHDGSFQLLEAVVDFYNAGGKSNPYRDLELRRLELTAMEKGDLIAFLQSLSTR
jgi:cytochrome c peroxidase